MRIFYILSLVISILFCPYQSLGQDELKKADEYFESGLFESGRSLLSRLSKSFEKGSIEYRLCMDKIAYSYMEEWDEVMSSSLDSKKLTFLLAFLSHIESEQDHLPDSYSKDRKYIIYESLIGEYLNRRNHAQAQSFQKKLYEAHQASELPESLESKYSLGKYSDGQFEVWGYEYFDGLAAEEDRGSYSKIIYSVYPANSSEAVNKELMQFHLKKIDFIDMNLGEFILVKRPGKGLRGMVTTLWDYSFDNPLDYLELREIIIALAKSEESRG